MRKLALSWGVYPVKCDDGRNIDEVIDNSIQSAKDAKYINNGELVVVTSGSRPGVSGATNLLEVLVIS